MDIDVRAHNRGAWNNYSALGEKIWTIGFSHEQVEEARGGALKLLLTPTKYIPAKWYPPLKGARVLCLASGGGQQGPLLAAAGADVTVYDNSPSQLATDRAVAEREGLALRTVEGDMRNLSAFEDDTFDLIVHPVSNCFVDDVRVVYHEAARVLNPGGALLAGFCNPVNYMFDWRKMDDENELVVAHSYPYSPFNEDAADDLKHCVERNEALEFGHTLEDQIGGQLDAGLYITGFFEDFCTPDRSYIPDVYMAACYATRAVKVGVL